MSDTPDTTPDPDHPDDDPSLSLDDQVDAILAAAGAEEAFAALDQDCENDASDKNTGTGEAKKSQATRLVELAERDFRMVRGADNKTYAVPLAGPHIALSLRSEHGLRMRLAAAYRAATDSVAGGGALTDALAVLEGQAAERDPEPIGLRVARHDGNLILDLGTADGRCIVISPGEWRVELESPILFRRTALISPLPIPARTTDGLDRLRALLNMSESGFRMVVSWLMATLFPDIDHPILSLTGEQGTAKSTCAKILVCLLDPSPAPLRKKPKDEETWVVQAAASWMVMLDNVSTIQPWFSDALCRAVTGDGEVKRSLFTNDDVNVLAFQRVIGMTTIDAGAMKGDLGERLLPVELDPIPETGRRSKEEVLAQYEADRPAILGAVLDLAAKVLKALSEVQVTRLPRLADYARILAALDKVTEWATLPAFFALANEITEAVIEADPFAEAIPAFARDKGAWSGTAGALLELVTPADSVPRDWPRTSRSAGGQLRRIAPALRARGIEVEFTRAPDKAGTRLVALSCPKRPDSCVRTSEPSEQASDQG